MGSDPSALLTRIDGLHARHARDKAKLEALEAERKKLRDQVKALKQTEKDAADLTRRLGSAHGALEAYRRETARLKGDLKAVRSSKTMKVGRAILKPVTSVRSAFGLTSGDAGEGPKQIEAPAAPSAPAAAPPTKDREPSAPAKASQVGAESTTPSAAPVARTTPVGQRSLETLIEEFEASPTPGTLSNVVNRQWYQLGLIEEPATLIAAHPELVEGLDASARTLARRILGEARLLRKGAAIPARSRGAAYLPEPGRVMYCAHSTPAFNSNGYSTRTQGVVAGLAAGGTDVVVVARAGYPWDSATDAAKPEQLRSTTVIDGVEYIHTPGPQLGATPIDRYFLAAADSFVREARLLRPSVIHSASNFRTALPALIAARRLGVPFVYEVRGLWEITEASDKPEFEGTPRFEHMKALETLVANEADAVLVITRQVADELERRGVDRSKMVLAANAVDPDQYVPLPKDQRWATKHSIRTDVPVIGFAGSIVNYEGLDLLLEASGLLESRGVEHQVVIAGSGAASDSLREQRDRDDLKHVMFLGRRPIAEMPRMLSTFDIVALPRISNPVTELVSPLKPLEAFSSAKAVVLSDVAPHLDLAGPNGSRAALFSAGDATALADQLQALIEDPDRRADLGRSARLWTRDERTWWRVGRAMSGAYAYARSHCNAGAVASKPLHALRVGLVADEFTTATLSASVQVTPLDRTDWREQLERNELDLVFIESAWAGNGGQWTKGVGYYGEAENTDLFALLQACRDHGIPSVFWNKEDPVHFDRFRRTAAECDHVFTTDANMILPYLETPGSHSTTASALPFYAQPAIHNPIEPATRFAPTAAYAGTYYGDRYAARSRQLSRLLLEASRFGLTIFDRQLAYPDSPYRFPSELQRHVRGHLPYDQVIDSYKSHIAQLNVNSVTDSPTMFSRRVVEVAACGGVVLSGPGRGVDETFGGVIPATNNNAVWRALLQDWSSNADERVREAWLQMRTVYRAHTVDTALTILARTAGVPTTPPALDSYAVVLDGSQSAVVDSLAQQSQLPLEVFVSAGYKEAADALAPLGIRVRGITAVDDATATWIGELHEPVERTYFEDLMLASRFGDWNRITANRATPDDVGRPLAVPTDIPSNEAGLARRDLVEFSRGLKRALATRPVNGVELLLPPAVEPTVVTVKSRPAANLSQRSARVLIAGHDLKFATGLIDALTEAGHSVELDQWQSHTQHDEERSREMLQQADVVMCEWGLGNAVWYSKHVSGHQRLVVRVHSQELRTPYLAKIKHDRVDQFIFVGELIRRAAVESHGLPAEKTTVIPNPVDVASLRLPKHEGSEFTLGLVGIVTQSKRLDRALDLLETLQQTDARYRLRIKGKQPSDYPWMKNRPDEMAYYEQQYARIDALNAAHSDSVVFDGFGPDMPEWYRNIGIAVSVSDFESFHLTIPDGAASGALPVSLNWPGADLIYPRAWLFPNTDAMAEHIHLSKANPDALARTIEDRFGSTAVLQHLISAIAPGTEVTQ